MAVVAEIQPAQRQFVPGSSGMSETNAAGDDRPADEAGSTPGAGATGMAKAVPVRLRGMFGPTFELVLLVILAVVILVPGIADLPATSPIETAARARADAVLAAPSWPERLLPGGIAAPAPPLAAWTQAGAIWLFGSPDSVPAWIPRVPSAFAAIVAVVLVWAAGDVAGGRRAGFLAGLMVALSLLTGLAARLAGPDALALAAVSAVGAALVSAAADGEPRSRPVRTAAFWIGLAAVLLVGGWTTGVVTLSMLVALVLVDPSLRRLKSLDPARGIIVVLVLLSPVLAAAVVHAYGGLVAPSTALLGWFSPSDAGRALPPGAQLVTGLATLWPLSAFVPVLLAVTFPQAPDPARRRVFIILLAWILPAWFVMEALPVKRPLDALHLAPALALAVGIALSAARMPVGRLSARAGWVFLSAAAVALVFGLNAAFVLAAGHASPSGLVTGTAAIVAGFVATRYLIAGRLAPAMTAVVAAAALVAALAFVVLPEATGWVWTAWLG
jgi:4-amino-4-deoxy-L-arabinose transferase-like glycosyltransferase